MKTDIELKGLEFELNDITKDILGTPNFVAGSIANILRKSGLEIEHKAEKEQATVIYWMLCLYKEHGSEWRNWANKTLKNIQQNHEKNK